MTGKFLGNKKARLDIHTGFFVEFYRRFSLGFELLRSRNCQDVIEGLIQLRVADAHTQLLRVEDGEGDDGFGLVEVAAEEAGGAGGQGLGENLLAGLVGNGEGEVG